jgi:hypothetical protein
MTSKEPNNTLSPITTRAIPPILESHLVKSGALFRSQPVAPPRIRRGDKVVPVPNKTAKMVVLT